MTHVPEVPRPNPPISAEEQAAVRLLTEQDLAAIDACIMKHCSDRFLKVARVLGRAEEELAARFRELSSVFYVLRLQCLVDEGHLEAAGNLAFMRFSEVRLARRQT